MKSILIGLVLFILTLAGCKASHSSVSNKNLPTITDLNQLSEGQKAIYKTPSGKKYIINRKRASEEKEDTISSLYHRMNGVASLSSELMYLPNANCDAAGCPDHCDFDGVKRKESKTSISGGNTITYAGVTSFLTSFADLNPDAGMSAIVGSSNDRVPVEDFNATITKAWLYCFAKESDEDYHVVIGNSKDINDPDNRFMIVEVSGLPTSGPARSVLSQVQTDFFNMTGATCGSGYFWFDDGNAPLSVTVSGSVYWDTEHWSRNTNTMGTHGPSELRPRLTTVWEIHPITNIALK